MQQVFFFFKQKTAYEMKIRDWSSDVCSSDLYIIDDVWGAPVQMGRSKSVVEGKSVDLGGRRIIKKKKDLYVQKASLQQRIGKLRVMITR